jgi:hypothetical protein
MPIAALRDSSEVGFLQGIMQPELIHSLGRSRKFISQ